MLRHVVGVGLAWEQASPTAFDPHKSISTTLVCLLCIKRLQESDEGVHVGEFTQTMMDQIKSLCHHWDSNMTMVYDQALQIFTDAAFGGAVNKNTWAVLEDAGQPAVQLVKDFTTHIQDIFNISCDELQSGCGKQFSCLRHEFLAARAESNVKMLRRLLLDDTQPPVIAWHPYDYKSESTEVRTWAGIVLERMDATRVKACFVIDPGDYIRLSKMTARKFDILTRIELARMMRDGPGYSQVVRDLQLETPFTVTLNKQTFPIAIPEDVKRALADLSEQDMIEKQKAADQSMQDMIAKEEAEKKEAAAKKQREHAEKAAAAARVAAAKAAAMKQREQAKSVSEPAAPLPLSPADAAIFKLCGTNAQSPKQYKKFKEAWLLEAQQENAAGAIQFMARRRARSKAKAAGVIQAIARRRAGQMRAIEIGISKMQQEVERDNCVFLRRQKQMRLRCKNEQGVQLEQKLAHAKSAGVAKAAVVIQAIARRRAVQMRAIEIGISKRQQEVERIRLERACDQLLYYFSTDNMTKDAHLHGLQDDNGFVPLQKLMQWPRMREFAKLFTPAMLAERLAANPKNWYITVIDLAVKPTFGWPDLAVKPTFGWPALNHYGWSPAYYF